MILALLVILSYDVQPAARLQGDEGRPKKQKFPQKSVDVFGNQGQGRREKGKKKKKRRRRRKKKKEE